MSEVKLNNQNNQIKQVQPVQVQYVPCTCSPVLPNINNYNGYIPTYQYPYYTSNYGYQTPQVYNQYPAAQMVTNPVVQTNQPQITPGATIQAGGSKCEIPPGTNGLNIIINSPTVATPGSQPMINTNTNCYGNNNGNGNASSAAAASATAGNRQKAKTKNVVALTDDYIKNLENYLRSPNKDLKSYAIQEIAKRFEEDEQRKTNPSLNALLNLALQAKESSVRALALSLLITGYAGGNDVTVQILNNMQQSNVCKGMEANDAKKALLKMSETVVKVPDNSPDKVKKEDK